MLLRTTDYDVCAPELQFGLTNNGWEFFASAGEGKMLFPKQREKRDSCPLNIWRRKKLIQREDVVAKAEREEGELAFEVQLRAGLLSACLPIIYMDEIFHMSYMSYERFHPERLRWPFFEACLSCIIPTTKVQIWIRWMYLDLYFLDPNNYLLDER